MWKRITASIFIVAAFPLVMLALFAGPDPRQTTTTAWTEFTTAATATPGDTNWTSASLALTVSTDYAYSNPNEDQHTYWLKVTNPGSSLDEVIGKQIDGIEVQVVGQGQTGSGRNLLDSDVQLIIGGSLTGANKADLTTQWTTTATRTYGGAADKWSLTPDDSDIASSTFGVGVRYIEDGTNAAQMRVASIRVRITYSDPPAGSFRGGFFNLIF